MKNRPPSTEAICGGHCETAVTNDGATSDADEAGSGALAPCARGPNVASTARKAPTTTANAPKVARTSGLAMVRFILASVRLEGRTRRVTDDLEISDAQGAW